MHINEKEKRLEEIFRKNNNKGFAVAITGCWGVGKTFFWNKFLKEKTQEEMDTKEAFYYEASRILYISAFENKKYAYISLFGIESIHDLKNAICTKLSGNPYVYESAKRLEFSSLLKKSLQQFKDIKVSQYGVSASAKLLENILYYQVKDAIICFDDFERLSEKLKIQDVMGLANQLKLERNCQVILILDESKTDGENKNKYAEYKEKLIDESIKINSVEPLIRENTKEIDEPLVDLMVKFAEKLEIHNFRFFQKIIKLYRQFREQLPQEVAYSTKEIILVRILQGYLIEDFGTKYGISWNDFTLKKAVRRNLDKGKEDNAPVEKEVFKQLEQVSLKLVYSSEDIWFIQFQRWFEQRDSIDVDALTILANSEAISEKVNNIKMQREELWDKFWNNQLDENSIVKLYEKTDQLIGILEIENLAFTYDILKVLESNQLAYQLKAKIYQWVNAELNKNKDDFIDKFASFRQSRNCFYNYIDKYKTKNLYVGLPTLLEVVNAYVINRGWNPNHVLSLEISSKADWRKLLFEEVPNDERFSNYNSTLIATKMVNQSMKPELNPKIKQLITEIYEEKGQGSQFYRKYMDYLTSRLDN